MKKTEKETKDIIRNYLLRSSRETYIKDEDNLMDMGLIHSLFMIQLIIFIEKKFEIDLSEMDDIEDFSSINRIFQLISKH